MQRIGFVLASACVASLISVACSQREAVETYRTRGQVSAHNGTGSEARVSIVHEQIPTFKDRDGKVVGMESMEMIFGYAPAVANVSLQPGDKVAFTFDVRWSDTPPLLVTRIEKLPSDTALTLSAHH
jgi:Cu/Ag efflux protein CusF